MPTTISITGKRTSATVFCTNLILHGNSVVFLTAFGPTQEIRAFSHLLTDGGSSLDTGDHVVHKVVCSPNLTLIPKLDHGYTGLYLVTSQVDRYIIANSIAECYNIYARTLDQQQFVHCDWYKKIFSLATEIEPTIGAKKCYLTVENVSEVVQQHVESGDFVLPASTADLEVEIAETKSGGTQ
jgi:hypothetical protein